MFPQVNPQIRDLGRQNFCGTQEQGGELRERARVIPAAIAEAVGLSEQETKDIKAPRRL
ncbi:hypothetical protein ABZ468_31685 [Streptomyces sp. NPDC005708]|uniref:hypothetical protein n=1 Tax=Streptomyces sp. NPDC005708 TaxID=3154564 RepID=UPI0033E9AFAF